MKENKQEETASNNSEASTATTKDAAQKPHAPSASVSEVFSFVPTQTTKLQIAGAAVSAIISGCVLPGMAFAMASAFKSLSASTANNDFMHTVRRVAIIFLALGALILISATIQSFLMELAADAMATNLKTSWFRALLRQDMAYFDIRDATGEATIISSNGARYHKGMGRKFGEAIQYTVTFIGALVFAFYSSWETSLVVMCVSPLLFLSINFLLRMNQSQTVRANATYAQAGAIVNTALSSLRTILALNAVEIMIEKYKRATTEAFEGAAGQVWLLGVANGAPLVSFMMSYVVVTLFGSYLLYNNVEESGCDPSGTVQGNKACNPSGMDVFGALLGVGFAAVVLPQVAVALEAFSEARVACYPAIEVMNRKPDQVEKDDSTKKGEADKPTETHYRRGAAEMPPYQIDSSSDAGKKPDHVNGEIEFRDVHFSYPTRNEVEVFKGFSLTIPAGKTVALVGESGSGKSTSVQLLERFYDPTSGSIYIDGIDVRELNVKWLRKHVGLVSQEPKLFGSSIRDNIAAGVENATDEDVVEAATLANADSFIRSFPDGYNTQVGDLGGKLSGGQKQRIAISRVLAKKPKILILDEATSALDSESEAIVQNSFDKLVQLGNMTILVIAHRLSTIKNADIIAVVSDGQVVETGTHEELLLKKSHYYNLVQAQKTGPHDVHKEESHVEQTATEQTETANPGDVASVEFLPPPVTNDSNAIIQFHDVYFEYPSRPNTSVLRGFNLSIRRGETVALVGPSGSGKSTIIQLVECFYRPSSGRVMFNGRDMTEVNVRWLRDQLGLVSQEPVLFDTTIEENIRMGLPTASSEQVIAAAKLANAHKFISEFPDGYQTRVGQGSTLVSGGQKQRIAIARALLKNPPILLLDEATSALDSESEKVVQEALDKLLFDAHRTCIVIAHRLSTIRNADRIAVVDKGRVIEMGTHDELMANPRSRYRRLQDMQSLEVKSGAAGQAEHTPQAAEQEVDQGKSGERGEEIGKEVGQELSKKARLFASGDTGYFVVGGIGAFFAGLVFPGWGFLYAYMVELLFIQVSPCPPVPVNLYATCVDYWSSVGDDMQAKSLRIFYAFVGVMFSCILGNILLFWGFGTAVERMNKRLRDAAFTSLLRQEIAWFDLRPAAALSSSLADDTALLRAFAGEPIRTLVMNLASVIVGVAVAFYYMWPFALLALAILPFMAFGAAIKMKMLTGADEGDVNRMDENSPGRIVIETVSDIRTVASLALEDDRASQYAQALANEHPNPIRNTLVTECAAGLGQFIQLWGMALMFFWGGWLLYNYPNKYTYKEFLISMLAFLFSLYGLASALQGTVDKTEAKEAATRIFEIVDRQSRIDPLSEQGAQDV